MNTSRIRGIATCLRAYLQVDVEYMSQRSVKDLITTNYYGMYCGARTLPVAFWGTATRRRDYGGDLLFPISPHWCGISNT